MKCSGFGVKCAGSPKSKVHVTDDQVVIRAGQFEVRSIGTPGHASHHNVYHWDDNLFGGDVAGVRLDGGPPVPPFVPPELQVESWLESIERMRALGGDPALPAAFRPDGRRYCRAFRRARRAGATLGEWFRDELRKGRGESELVPDFAQYEARDIVESGAAKERVADYERADPSFMAVTASIRYWQKYHP